MRIKERKQGRTHFSTRTLDSSDRENAKKTVGEKEKKTEKERRSREDRDRNLD